MDFDRGKIIFERSGKIEVKVSEKDAKEWMCVEIRMIDKGLFEKDLTVKL